MATLPGLIQGFYRGIAFDVPDTTTKAGRRLVEYLFPGVEDAAYDDFGRHPGEVTLNGVIAGDLYQVQALALEAAFNRPGPAMLIHPWRGPMRVILAEPATITLASRELRIVRFSAKFKTVQTGFTGLSGGFGGILSAVALIGTAVALLSSAVSSRSISAARTRAVNRSAGVVRDAVGDLQPVAGSARFLPRLTNAASSLAPTTPEGFETAVADLTSRFGEASDIPFIAAAAEAIREEQATPAALTALGLNLGAALSGTISDAPSDPDRALLAVAAAHAIAQASAQIPYTAFDSAEQAHAVRSSVLSSADSLIDATSGLVTGRYAGEADELVSALETLKVEVTAALNEIIGQLPETLTLQLTGPTDAWIVAAHIAGDNPAGLEAVWQDIVSRNCPRHPSRLPAGEIKVLKP
ncbi:DNA circularization N-terminal domain-containing protein [Martelella mediterranea]|uniref:Prophage DNA circulation protein n=1 Tax=Martelella mediterranea TaxID=293089 RepID=A0A4R3NSU3_9HYPH|nr:DNA circularization N-terminal domain-containing protein [Martelella mediterranea]TCT35370.1 prophage DNA circulation protein [Martelella mediterranea]